MWNETKYDEEEEIRKREKIITDDTILIEEVTEVVRLLKKGKAAGNDNITAEMSQNMGENRFEVLTEL